MIGWNKFDDSYFLKYSEKPVKLKPYIYRQTEIAEIYLEQIKKILDGITPKLIVRGSTAFKILGKGDIEVGVYPSESDWLKVISLLSSKYGPPENVEKDYVRFNSIYGGYEIEIIILKGHEAKVDLALTEYLINHPGLLKEYENVKKTSSFSKREYQIQKNKFLSKVIEMIPDEKQTGLVIE